jgi:hypothetical protein
VVTGYRGGGEVGRDNFSCWFGSRWNHSCAKESALCGRLISSLPSLCTENFAQLFCTVHPGSNVDVADLNQSN